MYNDSQFLLIEIAPELGFWFKFFMDCAASLKGSLKEVKKTTKLTNQKAQTHRKIPQT